MWHGWSYITNITCQNITEHILQRDNKWLPTLYACYIGSFLDRCVWGAPKPGVVGSFKSPSNTTLVNSIRSTISDIKCCMRHEWIPLTQLGVSTYANYKYISLLSTEPLRHNHGLTGLFAVKETHLTWELNLKRVIVILGVVHSCSVWSQFALIL